MKSVMALFAVAAMTAVSAGVASAQDVHAGPGGVSVGSDHAYRDQDRDHYRDRGDNCHLVITHRRGPDGSVTVRRRICD